VHATLSPIGGSCGVDRFRLPSRANATPLVKEQKKKNKNETKQ